MSHAEFYRKCKVEAGLLVRCIETFGRCVLHIFDRGFATEPRLHLCVILQQRARGALAAWAVSHRRTGASAASTWEIARGKRAWGKRRIWNAHLHRHLETSVLAFPVRHPDFAIRVLQEARQKDI